MHPRKFKEEDLDRLVALGLLVAEDETSIREDNVGKSNYAAKTIQPWSIWLDYPELTSWDHDIVKRVLRKKDGDSRELDYRKIMHICEERLRQLGQASVNQDNTMKKYRVRIEVKTEGYDLAHVTVQAGSKEDAVKIASQEYHAGASFDYWASDYIENKLDEENKANWEVVEV